MHTMGLFGFRKNGIEKLTYNHHDSYPKGLGIKVVKLCRSFSINDLNRLFDEIVMVEEDDKMTEEQKQTYKKYLPEEYGNENLDWLTVLKYNNDITMHLIDGFRYMVEYGTFIGAQRCRWIYIINLDNNMLEIYKNGLEILGTKTDDIVPPELYPKDLKPLLVGNFPLNDIPENWVEIM